MPLVKNVFRPSSLDAMAELNRSFYLRSFCQQFPVVQRNEWCMNFFFGTREVEQCVLQEKFDPRHEAAALIFVFNTNLDLRVFCYYTGTDPSRVARLADRLQKEALSYLDKDVDPRITHQFIRRFRNNGRVPEEIKKLRPKKFRQCKKVA
jgi:hypothetical protein